MHTLTHWVFHEAYFNTWSFWQNCWQFAFFSFVFWLKFQLCISNSSSGAINSKYTAFKLFSFLIKLCKPTSKSWANENTLFGNRVLHCNTNTACSCYRIITMQWQGTPHLQTSPGINCSRVVLHLDGYIYWHCLKTFLHQLTSWSVMCTVLTSFDIHVNAVIMQSDILLYCLQQWLM